MVKFEVNRKEDKPPGDDKKKYAQKPRGVGTNKKSVIKKAKRRIIGNKFPKILIVESKKEE